MFVPRADEGPSRATALLRLVSVAGHVGVLRFLTTAVIRTSGLVAV